MIKSVTNILDDIAYGLYVHSYNSSTLNPLSKRVFQNIYYDTINHGMRYHEDLIMYYKKANMVLRKQKLIEIEKIKI